MLNTKRRSVFVFASCPCFLCSLPVLSHKKYLQDEASFLWAVLRKLPRSEYISDGITVNLSIEINSANHREIVHCQWLVERKANDVLRLVQEPFCLRELPASWGPALIQYLDFKHPQKTSLLGNTVCWGLHAKAVQERRSTRLALILQAKPSIAYWNSLSMARWPAGAQTLQSQQQLVRFYFL